jgi:uncharacterized membrane protein
LTVQEVRTLTSETGWGDRSEGWRIFLAKHWKIFILFVVGAIIAFIGAILVFLWFVGEAQSSSLVPTILGLWTMGYLVTFLLNLIFWELLFVGIPVALAAVAVWMWWRKLPLEERKGYRFFNNRSRASNGGNAISLFVFIAFCIKVYIDGNWNTAFLTWTLDYLVYSVVTVMAWILIIIGIPVALGLIWWISRGRKHIP